MGGEGGWVCVVYCSGGLLPPAISNFRHRRCHGAVKKRVTATLVRNLMTFFSQPHNRRRSRIFSIVGGHRPPLQWDPLSLCQLLVPHLRHFCNRYPIVPCMRQVLLPHFEAKLLTRGERSLVLVQNFLAVVKNGLAVEIRKRHFDLDHAEWLVRTFFRYPEMT